MIEGDNELQSTREDTDCPLPAPGADLPKQSPTYRRLHELSTNPQTTGTRTSSWRQ